MLRDNQADWEEIGKADPFHGVLAHEKYLSRNLTPEDLVEFYQSGEADVEYLRHRISQLYPGLPKPSSVLDFGCGVGRLTRAMSRGIPQVTGVDISAGMLAEAKKHSPASIRYLDRIPAEKFHWANSLIVFQHIRPAVGYGLFQTLLDAVESGGVFSVHVTIFRDERTPTYTQRTFRDVAYDGESVTPFSTADDSLGTMHVYDYNLSRLTQIAIRLGFPALYLEHLDHDGTHGVRIFGRRS